MRSFTVGGATGASAAASRPARLTGNGSVVLLWVLGVLAVPALVLVAVAARPSLTIVAIALVGVVALVLVLTAPAAVIPTAWVLIVFVGVVRKLLAGSAGRVENDPLIALPFVLLLPFLVSRIWWIGRYRIHLWLCLVLAAVITASLLVVAVAVAAVPDLVTLRAFIQEVVPPLVAVALMHPALRESVRTTMTTVRLTTVAAAVYGLVQFVSPAPWDLRWLRNVALDQGIQSFGTPEPQQFRLFGPFMSPLAFALVLSIGIVCWAFSDTRLWWRIAAIAVLVVPLLLTQVRTSVFALALTLPVAALLHYRQRAVVPLALIGGGVAAIPIILTAIAPDLVNRFSLSKLNDDVSYNSRLRLLGATTGSIFRMGGGPGSSSSGSIATDNGYLAVFLEFGVIGGFVFLALLVAALGRAVQVALGPAFPDRVLPLAILGLYALSETSAPVMQGEQSLVFWLALAILGTNARALSSLSGRRGAAAPADRYMEQDPPGSGQWARPR